MRYLGLFLSLMFLFSGCGYRIFLSKEAKYRTIQIPPVKNAIEITSESQRDSRIKIYPKGLENRLTQSLKERFIWQQGLEVVNESADLTLECKVVDFTKDVISYTGEDDDEPLEYRLGCKVKVVLKDAKEGKVLLDKIVGEDDIFYAQNTTFQDALDSLSQRVSQRILEEVVFRWP